MAGRELYGRNHYSRKETKQEQEVIQISATADIKNNKPTTTQNDFEEEYKKFIEQLKKTNVKK